MKGVLTRETEAETCSLSWPTGGYLVFLGCAAQGMVCFPVYTSKPDVFQTQEALSLRQISVILSLLDSTITGRLSF